MKLSLLLLTTLFISPCTYSQTKDLVAFQKFSTQFKSIMLPIDQVEMLTSEDTLDANWVNETFYKRESPKSKKGVGAWYVTYQGKLIRNTGMGKYSAGPFTYGKIADDGSEIKCVFYEKIYSIGKIQLTNGTTGYIIKANSLSSIYYDLWILNKAKDCFSAVCLYYAEKEHEPSCDDLYLIIDSKITETGDIIWHSNQRGLHTYRTYRVNEDGYFQVIEERKEGEFDY